MARASEDPDAGERGRLAARVGHRRIQAWRDAGLVRPQMFLVGTPSTVWLTADGMQASGLPWRPHEPTLAPCAHRHAVGLVRAEAGDGARLDLRTGAPRRTRWAAAPPARRGGAVHRHVGQAVAHRRRGGADPQAEARVAAILRQLVKTYDDVVYRAHPSATTVVHGAAAALPRWGSGAGACAAVASADPGRGHLTISAQ
jgi:hypothetical protein